MAQVETQYHTEKFQQEIDALARIFLPEIQKFSETEAGRRAILFNCHKQMMRFILFFTFLTNRWNYKKKCRLLLNRQLKSELKVS